MKTDHLLARRTEKMKANAIREILHVVSQPGMISLAGGLPSPDAFPLHLMAQLTDRVLTKYGARSLQYDATEGFYPLREALSNFLATKSVVASSEGILVFSGSQGVLDAVGKVLITAGDAVAVEAPTYLGAISAFNPYEPQYVTVESDDDGMIPASLDDVLQRNKIKFVYLVSTFQNPTGRSLNEQRRQEIAEILIRNKALLVEDDPYGDLRYQGKAAPPIKHFAPDNVIYISTLSKTFAPGLRIGFTVPPPSIHKWLVVAKQGVDLHTSTINQAMAAEYLSGAFMEDYLPKIIELYQPRQQAMLKALEQHFPADYRWTQPEGGMFIWIEGPTSLNAEALYWRAVDKKVAFVPGEFFFTDPARGKNTLRLNFTSVDQETIAFAVKTLASAI